ncbi:MAG: hypothetical protein HUK24_02995 [Sphaerochaetaceae bacterium]|nr:hypothetical protein [Sphaerochaetaceae bacterium]
MKKISVLLLMFLLVINLAFGAKIIKLESDFYTNMDALYALCGKTNPSTIRPWTDTEARAILSKIDPDTLTGTASRLYELLDQEINETGRITLDSDTKFDVKGDFAFETYGHSNTADFITDSAWIRGYDKRKPMVKLTVEAEVRELFYTLVDIQYGWGRVTTLDQFEYYPSSMISNDGYIGSYKVDGFNPHYAVWASQYAKAFATNFMTVGESLEFETPKRAIIALSGNNWSFNFGRDKIEVGLSQIGNLLVDNHNDFSEFANLSFYSERFKFDMMYIFLNTLIQSYEEESDSIKMYMIHMFEFTPNDKFSFIISENVMSQQSKLDPLYLNPAFIYHNLNNRGMFNALLYISGNYMPINGLNLYGQFAMDQAQAPYEGDSQADASGYLLGVNYTTEMANGVANAYVEYSYTTPCLYRRDGLDFIRASRYTHNGSNVGTYQKYGRAIYFDFIGTPYGGDFRAIQSGVSFNIPGLVTADFYIQGMEHGAMNIFMSHNIYGNNDDDANYKEKTPSGSVTTRSLTTSLKATFNCSSFFSYPSLTIEAEYDWIGIWDFTKATKTYSNFKNDHQLSLSVELGI